MEFKIKKRIRYLFLWIFVCAISGNLYALNLKKGSVAFSKPMEEVSISKEMNLLIVPVELDGTTYRFLFDTGAVTAISKELQNKFNYKVVDRGHIVDSDGNRSPVNYVRVDELLIGATQFTKQTAFVADLQANPVLACLNLDGIIGSNLIRHCNWQIDVQSHVIKLSPQTFNSLDHGEVVVPFVKDKQYSMLVNFKVGRATVKNIKVDYGNNNVLTVPKSIFKVLEQRALLDTVYTEVGETNGGIAGKSVALNRNITLADSFQLGADGALKSVVIKAGKSGLLGMDVLSIYKVSIHWSTHQLVLQAYENTLPNHKQYDFSLGINDDGEPYVQSVFKNSVSDKFGIKPGMQVLKINDIDFSQQNFCQFILDEQRKSDTMTLLLFTPDGEQIKYKAEKINL